MLCGIICGVNTTIVRPLPPSTDDPLCLAIEYFQAEFQPFAAHSAVVVGVSGGADSVCLLHLLVRYAPLWQIRIQVAHLDHALRPDSAEDAAFVARLAAAWDLSLHQRRLPPAALTDNIEAAARNARYTFLAEIADQVGAALIAVAHNADDQAETLLLHLLRGSGLDGLAAMRPMQPLPGNHSTPAAVPLARPLLGVRRTQILRYLHEHDLPWREDSSNADLTFTRNWLRHSLLPHMTERFPSVQDALTRTATILADEADRAEATNRAVYAALLHPQQDGGAQVPRLILDRRGYLGQNAATQRGIVRCLWADLGAPPEALTFDLVEAVRRLVATDKANAGPFSLAASFVLTLTEDWLVLHRSDRLPISPDHPFLGTSLGESLGTAWVEQLLPIPGTLDVGNWRLTARRLTHAGGDLSWQKNNDAWIAYFDAEQIDTVLLSTPRPGDRFAPLGLHGRHKNVGDLLTDHKIPPFLRSGWPLIRRQTDDTILWVCGVQPGHIARVTEQTQSIVRLCWEARAAS